MNNQFSPKISEVLIYSKEEALRLHNECVAPEHLLLGLIRDGEGKAIQILRLLNLDFRSVNYAQSNPYKVPPCRKCLTRTMKSF